MEVKIKVDLPFESRECKRCHRTFGPQNFIPTSSPFFANGYSDICGYCISDYLKQNDFNWENVDKVCQYFNIPFIPNEFERLHDEIGDLVFTNYAAFFQELEYEGLNWKEYFLEFKKLKEAGYIEDELPILRDQHRRELKEKWGFNYDDEALFYLDALYQGMLETQNITGPLQVDQAEKLCKISLELNQRIEGGGQDIDKLIGSYEKLVKVAEFTPKNVKNASDFDSVGELVKWLEKRGFVNSFYDNVTRDIVDETIKNIQAYNQRLYVNESGIGEQITDRLEGLKHAEELDNFYGINDIQADDNYENKGYADLMDDGEFSAEV